MGEGELGEIVALCWKYSSALDEREWEVFADCFVASATLVFAVPPLKVVGRGALTEQMRSATSEYTGVQHVVSNFKYEVRGRHATGTTGFVAWHWVEVPEGHASFLVMGGLYRDRVVREHRQWRFAERRIELRWARHDR